MILITTPNGKVGSEVVKQLQAKGEQVRLGAHTVEKAQKAFPGAEVVHFDFGNEDSVRSALRDVDKLYLASPAEMQAEPVNRVVDLAKEAGVKHIVRLSGMGVEHHSDSPLRQIEQHIEASGLAWTFLRPTWFMQNYSMGMADGIRQGTVMEPAESAATGFVDARDIAAVGVAALTGDGHAGQAYAITGPEALTRDQVAAKISAAIGKPVRYQAVSAQEFEAGMRGAGAPEGLIGLMGSLYGFVRAGQTAGLTTDVQQVTGRTPISFDQFARDHADAWH